MTQDLLIKEIQNCKEFLYPGSPDSNLYEKILALEQCCKDTSAAIEDLKLAFSSTSTSLGNLTSTVAGHTISLGNLTSTVAEHTTSLNNLTSTVAGHTTTIASQGSRITALEATAPTPPIAGQLPIGTYTSAPPLSPSATTAAQTVTYGTWLLGAYASGGAASGVAEVMFVNNKPNNYYVVWGLRIA